MEAMPFETLEHAADIGLRITGTTLSEVFAEAAAAVTSLMIDRFDLRAMEPWEVEVEAPNLEMLLVRWLGLLLAEKDLSGRLFTEFDVHVVREDVPRLRAVARGERIDPQRHRVGTEVKGITDLGLTIEETPDGWIAECVVDV